MSEMPRYYLRIEHGKYFGAADSAFDVKDAAAAWQELIDVCGDLVGGVCSSLKENADWHMEVLDETKKPLHRIRLVAESLT
jgi:hypothetical protein